jgi:heme/copper-type cytochrome/quinol oxidase subunit 2
MAGRLATAQWISIAVMIVATVLLILRHWNWSWRQHQDDTQAKLSVNAPLEPVAV